MKLEVLISTMNQKDIYSLISKMNIQTDAVVINQCERESYEEIVYKEKKIRIFNCAERGLSKSRNKAIKESKADICIIADDDMTYVDNYEEIIKKAYKKYEMADMIAFYVSSENPNNIKPKLIEGKLGPLKSFKIQSVQLTFKRRKIKEKKIRFDENFGAGLDLYMGEENIFIFDCIKSGLNLYSYPIEFARLDNRESTWFKGYDEKYFKVKGACFYRISRILWIIICLQFVIRKRKLYKNYIHPFNAFENMLIGRRDYLNTLKNG